jgi:hypothetical protein
MIILKKCNNFENIGYFWKNLVILVKLDNFDKIWSFWQTLTIVTSGFNFNTPKLQNLVKTIKFCQNCEMLPKL